MTTYTKPQLLNMKKASTNIKGTPKPPGLKDSNQQSSASSYRSDE